MARSNKINLKVLFFDSWGAEKRYDPTMSATYAWDESVLRGFDHAFTKKWSLFRTTYTGADRVGLDRLWLIGAILYYCRDYFGVFSPELLRRLWTRHYDVLIIEGYNSINYLLAILIARMKGATVLLRSEAYLHSFRSAPVRAMKKLYLACIRPLLSRIIYSNHSGREYYLYYGIPSKKLNFVPSAVDNRFFLEASRELEVSGNPLQERFIDKAGKKLFLFLGSGRVVSRKNWLECVMAFEKLNRLGTGLIIVGDGPELPMIRSYVEARGIANVYLEGFKTQRESCAYYHVADVCVLTADYDPSPKVLNEALVFGRPVIVSDSVGTAKELVDDNGFTYRHGDVDDLADKMRLMIDQKERRAAFACGSLRLASEWSIERAGEMILDVIVGDHDGDAPKTNAILTEN